MQKGLNAKLDKMSREQLLELTEELCNVPDTERLIKAIVVPSKRDIDRLVQKLSDRCEIFMCNSCSAKDFDRILLALKPIYAAYRFSDINTSAYITWKTYLVLCENDIEDYYELIGDMLSDLKSNLSQHAELFSTEERSRYAEITQE